MSNNISASEPVTIKIDQFEGPLSLLLSLIEEQKLTITEVSIGQVTEQYLQLLRNHERGMDPELLADFLVIAARLLYLKSKALFPNLGIDDEDDAGSLEDQLRLYQRFVAASKLIDKRFHERKVAFARERIGGNYEKVFTPPRNLTPDKMKGIILEVIKSLERVVEVPQEVIHRTISLKDMIQKVQNMLSSQSKIGFKTLLRGAKNRTEVVITFLALLELVKQKSIVVQQDAMFGEMEVVKNGVSINK